MYVNNMCVCITFFLCQVNQDMFSLACIAEPRGGMFNNAITVFSSRNCIINTLTLHVNVCILEGLAGRCVYCVCRASPGLVWMLLMKTHYSQYTAADLGSRTFT